MNLDKINIKEHFTDEEWNEKERKREKLYKNMAKIMNKRKLPFMELEEIEAFKNVLLNIGDYLNILEWGSGYSTKYFSDLLDIGSVKFKWDSLEIDVRWYVEVLKLDLSPNVKVHLFDEEIMRVDDRRALRRFQMNEYVKFPSRLGKRFDIIFIDGSKRNRCLEEAIDLLKPNGVVLLHDAQREYYKEGMDLYNGKFLAKTLWIGKSKKFQ